MPSITNAAAIAACNAVVDLIDGGTTDPAGQLVIYDGVPPANVEAALSGNNILAEVDMQNPAFGPAADGNPGGVATLLGVPLSDNSINATGTASFARIFDRDNVALMQLTVGTSGAEVIVNSTAFQVGATFTITAGTVTMPEA